MFTRSSSAEPPALEPRTARAAGVRSPQPRANPAPPGEKSVIGNDLKIIGQGLKIIGRGILQVDGEIEGDVQAVEVIIGDQGKVTGMVAGDQVVVRGKVSGAVCAKHVAAAEPLTRQLSMLCLREEAASVQRRSDPTSSVSGLGARQKGAFAANIQGLPAASRCGSVAPGAVSG